MRLLSKLQRGGRRGEGERSEGLQEGRQNASLCKPGRGVRQALCGWRSRPTTQGGRLRAGERAGARLGACAGDPPLPIVANVAQVARLSLLQRRYHHEYVLRLLLKANGTDESRSGAGNR